ncbi:MAG: ribose-phosphate pyrophosphokinase [Chloroflexi bacterium]|nr:ribose-phosphate pyrophosphokinase [Chloroflexota bacterium]
MERPGVNDELKIFTGNAHPDLAKAICSYLETPLGQAEVFQFSNENVFVRILENVRSRDVFIVQPFCSPVQKGIMEMLIMIDAAKRASAERITAVVPYYAYGRTDKKDQPRVPITARLLADLITVAGANRVLTMDLHAPQIQGFFNIPVDELTALPTLADYFAKQQEQLGEIVVVATDIGISKKARNMAARLDCPLAIIEKRRAGNHDTSEVVTVIGDVEGKTAITFDDEVDTGGSLVGAVQALQSAGVKKVYSCATHPILSGEGAERIAASSIQQMVVTDTVPLPREKRSPRLKVLTVAPLFGEAIRRIHLGESVGAMFK